MDRLPGGKVAYPRSRNLVCVSLVAAVVFMIGFRNQFVEAFFGGYGRPLSQDMQIEILAKLDIMEAKMQRMAAGRSRSMSMKRPPNLCDYSDDQIESILQLPHGSRKGELRYYYHRSGAWVNLTGLDLLVKDLGPEQLPAVPGVVCTVVSIMGQVPCQTEACLLQVNWRPNSTDWWVIDQLLEKGEYEIVSGLQGSPATVLDAGANFGLGTLFFATMWPQARIVTIEPADSNFKMVELNTRDHPNVIRVKAGLWWRVAKLAMVDVSTYKPLEILPDESRSLAGSSRAWASTTTLAKNTPAMCAVQIFFDKANPLLTFFCTIPDRKAIPLQYGRTMSLIPLPMPHGSFISTVLITDPPSNPCGRGTCQNLSSSMQLMQGDGSRSTFISFGTSSRVLSAFWQCLRRVGLAEEKTEAGSVCSMTEVQVDFKTPQCIA